ncbi:MAG: hypothetical protein ACOCZ5_02195 [bacterium]
MSRQTGIEHLKDGSGKERIKNFFAVKGAKTDMELVKDEVEDEVRFELIAQQYFRELDKKEEDAVNKIIQGMQKKEFDDEVPDVFWKV